MRHRPSIALVLSILAAMSCTGERPAPVDSQAEQPPPTAPPTLADSIAEPQPPAAPPTLESIVEGLSVAWYDADARGTDDALHVLCNELEWNKRTESDERTACTTEAGTLHVIDGQGTAPWTVLDRHERLQLVRAEAQFPELSMPALALLQPPPAKDVRLSSLPQSRPSPRPDAVLLELAHRIAKRDEVHPDNLPLSPLFEIHGAFGGGADTIVVFEIEADEESDGFGGVEVVVAFAGGQPKGIFGDPALLWTGHAFAGVTDLDGDGVYEVLWWGTGEGLGIGFHLTWFANGEYRRTNLFACECGNYFSSAYRRMLFEPES